jgi:hypothetical protein
MASFRVSLYYVLLVIEPLGIIIKTHYSKPCLKYLIVTLTEL